MNRFSLVAVLAGCHHVFGVPYGEEVGDGGATDASCADSHDEDGDTFADCEDNCPGIANPDQADQLEVIGGLAGDGVGDQCDPNPGLPGDRLARFISFADANAIDRWNPVAPWSLDGEDLHVDSSSANVAYVLDAVMSLAPPYTTQFAFTIESLATGQYAELALVADVTMRVPTERVFCGIARYGTPAADYVIVGSDHAVAPGVASAPYGSEFQAGRHVAELRYAPAQLVCSIRSAMSGKIAAEVTLAGVPPQGEKGFGAYGVAARIHYLAIYTSGE